MQTDHQQRTGLVAPSSEAGSAREVRAGDLGAGCANAPAYRWAQYQNSCHEANAIAE